MAEQEDNVAEDLESPPAEVTEESEEQTHPCAARDRARVELLGLWCT